MASSETRQTLLRQETDLLHLLTKDELPKLLEWLEQHLPESWRLFGMVREEVLGRWNAFHFFSLGWPNILAAGTGNPCDDGKLVDYFTTPLRVTVYSPEETNARRLLTHPGYLDWTQCMLFMVPHELGDLVVSLSKEYCSKDDLPQRDITHVMEAKPGCVLPRLLPAGMTTKELQFSKHGELAKKNWFRKPYSDKYMEEVWRHFPVVGVFGQDGSCLGYECFTEFGTMGMLFVREEARGQGIGSFLTSKMAEMRFQDGHSAVISVQDGNGPSARLHQRLGFKTVCKADIIIHARKIGQKEANEKGSKWPIWC